MTATQTRIKHVAFFMYPVSNMAKARKFYEEFLELPMENNYSNAWIEYDIAGQTLAVTTMAEGSTPGARGGGIGLEVEDLDAFFDQVRQHQVPILKEPFETPVCRIGLIADPDGNCIAIHQLKSAH